MRRGPLNVTDDQMELLGKIVDIYGKGHREAFLFSGPTSTTGPTLIYNGRENLAVDADEIDLTTLEQQGLLSLARSSSGGLRGKPTALGISLIRENFSFEAGGTVSGAKNLTGAAYDRPPNRIFIGHGRSQEWRKLKDFISDRLGLAWDEFNREPVAGTSTKERLQEMLSSCNFAFVVTTGEDPSLDGAAHARENVIHEIGLFQGKLGFEKAIILMEEGCAEFSNIQGLTQIRFPPNRIEICFEEIRRVLEREGFLPPTKTESSFEVSHDGGLAVTSR